MRYVAMLMLVFLSACSHASKKPSCDGWRTELGICVENAPMSQATRNMIDNSFAEAQSCWNHLVDGNTLKVWFQEGRTVAESRWSIVFAYPGIRYTTMRHEFSHIVGGRKIGSMPPNGYGKCWL